MKGKVEIKNKNKISVEELKEMLSNLPETHTLILKKDGYFVCGIYYKNGEWRFMFNDFAIYSFSGNDQRGLVGSWERHLKMYSKDGTVDYMLFDNMRYMCYVIRNEIMSGITHTLMNPKFMLNGKECESNLPKIIPEVKENLGKVVDFGHGNDNEGILVGLSSTLEDYYYVYITSDGKLRFDSCVGSFKPLAMSSKDYRSLINNPSRMIEIMSEHFDDPLCTEICVVSI